MTDYSIDVVTLATRAEELGFDSLWVPEHAIIPVERTQKVPAGSTDEELPKKYFDTVDPFVTLAAAAAVTTTLKLATGVTLLPERNPLLLAKEAATLDVISGGRFIMGIGAGWIKEETEIMGGNFERRWAQCRESVLAMKQLWTTVMSEFHGDFYDFPQVFSFPRPVQRPHPPVILGGGARNVFKRVVEYGDGWLPLRTRPELVAEGRKELDRLAEDAGRDPRSLEITCYQVPPDADHIRQLEEAGADRVVIQVDTARRDEALAQLESHARALL